MNEAFEQAWLLLKSQFQPSQGERLGEGANQLVYGIEGDPDVTKLGHGYTLDDMYTHNILSQMPQMTNLIAGQKPIAMDEMLSDADMKFFEAHPLGNEPAVMSTQIRGEPVREQHNDKARGLTLANTLYDKHKYGQLLEAKGLADIGPRNWMTTPSNKGVFNVKQITGNPNEREDRAIIHDAQFYGPSNPVDEEARAAFEEERGTPRRLGTDYTLPEEQSEAYLQTMDKNPFDDFVEPYLQSVEEFYPKQLDSVAGKGGSLDQQLNTIIQRLRLMGLDV